MSSTTANFIKQMFQLCFIPFTWTIPGFNVSFAQLFFGIIGTTIVISVALRLLGVAPLFVPREPRE